MPTLVIKATSKPRVIIFFFWDFKGLSGFNAGSTILILLMVNALAASQQLVIPVRKTVADVVAEQNERNVGKAQLAAR